MTPTPRVDKASVKAGECYKTAEVVHADFARELERENVELRRQIEHLKADRDSWQDQANQRATDAFEAMKECDRLTAARSALEPAQPPAQKQ